MTKEIRWADRDAGQKFSMMMFVVFGFAASGTMLILGIKLLQQPDEMKRLNGAAVLVLLAFSAFRTVRWWRSRHAG